jgi:EpsI family protein
MKKKESGNGAIWHYCIAVVLMLMSGAYMRYFAVDEIPISKRPLEEFPRHAGRWESVADHDLGERELDILKVDDYIYRDFRGDGYTASLYIGYYSTHRRFAEIHTPENCQAGSGWTVIEERTKEMNIPGKGKIKMREAVYEKDREEQLFLYWYDVDGRQLTSFFAYKMNVILNSLVRHRTDAAFVRVAVPIVRGNIYEAMKAGESFLQASFPTIETFINPKATGAENREITR